MSTTVNVYPTTTAHNYWSNSSWTTFSPYTRSLAGVTSNTYRWPIPFDLSAYAGKTLVTLKLNVKFSSASNTFSGAERLDVGVRATNSSAADAAAATYLDQVLPVDEQWCVFDVELAWDTLKAGTGYLVLSSDEEYAVLYNNYGTVDLADRPYLQLVYEDGTINYGSSGAWDECLVYYGVADSWVQVKPYYGSSDAWNEIGGQ